MKILGWLRDMIGWLRWLIYEYSPSWVHWDEIRGGEAHSLAFNLRAITNNRRAAFPHDRAFQLVADAKYGKVGKSDIWFVRCDACMTPMLMMLDREHKCYAACCVGCWKVVRVLESEYHGSE